MPPLHGGAHSPTTATRPSSTAAFLTSLATKKVSDITVPKAVVLGTQRAVFAPVLTAAVLPLTDRLVRLQRRRVSASTERRGTS